MITDRIKGSHKAMIRTVELEFAAATLSSCIFSGQALRLEEWLHIACSSLGDSLGKRVIQSIRYFEQTYVRIPISEVDSLAILELNLNLYRVLKKWGLCHIPITTLCQHSLKPNKRPKPPGNLKYSFVYTPVVQISYASFAWLAPFFHLFLLQSQNPPALLMLISSNSGIGVKGQLSFIKNSPLFETLDIDSDYIEHSQLVALAANGSSDECIKTSMENLFNLYGIESTNYFQRFADSSGTSYVREANILLLRQASRVWGKLHMVGYRQKLLPSRLFEVARAGLPIIGIANRDAGWVGQGQPWRDTPISRFESLVLWLLKNGFTVIRLNSIGDPLSINHHHLVDLTKFDLDFSQQLEVCSLLTCCISSSSGVNAYPIHFLHKRTLIIDASISFVDGLADDTATATRKLFVKNSKLFEQANFLSIIEILQSNIWSPEVIDPLGLGLRELSEKELLDETKYFINNLAVPLSKVYSSSHHLFCKYASTMTICDQYLSPRTFQWMSELLELKLKCNFSLTGFQ